LEKEKGKGNRAAPPNAVNHRQRKEWERTEEKGAEEEGKVFAGKNTSVNDSQRECRYYVHNTGGEELA